MQYSYFNELHLYNQLQAKKRNVKRIKAFAYVAALVACFAVAIMIGV